VSFLVDEGVSPVLLQLLSCALCGSKVLAALAASTGSSSAASSSAPVTASSGQATTQSKSSTKKSKKEEKEKEKDGKSHLLVLVIRMRCLILFWNTWFILKF
jgi:E3 ubiquitin-protein ligase UBR4